MIFQRGNPRLRALGRRPGHGGLGLRPLPALLQAHGDPAPPAPTSGAAARPARTSKRGPATSPLFGAFFEAVQQAGHPLTDDVNGYRQEGFAKFDRNVHRGRRLSAARAYLHPVMSRPNLDVHTLAHVTGLRMQGNRVTGVDYVRARKAHRSVEAKEVILCGGAINTPQLLQLAGIGNAEELRALGIDPVVDLPGVGENLQDHLEVYIQHASKQPVSIAPWMKHRHKPRIGAEWLFRRSGVGASNHFEAGGFIRSNDAVTYPNLMFHFLPIAIRYDGSQPASEHGYQVHIGLMYSDCRGTVKIRSTDPRVPGAAVQLPVDRDRPSRVDRDGPRRTDILEQPAFALFSAGEISPGPSVRTDEEILDWVAMTRRPRCTRRAPRRWAPTR